jgi:hypothetical protein
MKKTKEGKPIIHTISKHDVDKWRLGTIRPVAGIGIPELDDYIRFKRNFTIVGGIANTGKTTNILYIMLLWSMFHEDKPVWVICLSENDNIEAQVMLIEFYRSKRITAMSEDEMMASKAFIDQHFIFLNNDRLMGHHEIFEEIQGIADETRVDGAFVDPYSGFKMDSRTGTSSPYLYSFEVSARIRSLCRKKNIKVILSHHPNTESSRRVHKDEDTIMINDQLYQLAGHAKPIRAADLEMGTVWQNRADDFWTAHRYTQHHDLKMYGLIEVTKVKQVRTGGRTTSLGNPIIMEMKEDLTGFYIGGIDHIKERQEKLIQTSLI